MTILLLGGSPSNSSRSTRLLHHVGERLAAQDLRCSRLNVLDLPAQALLHADFNHTDIKVARALVEQADAIILGTPVYKGAYSGILKAFLDLLPQDGFDGKLAMALGVGGSQSLMLALDYALRPVLFALGVKHVMPSIFATDAQIGWSADNQLVLDTAIEQRVDDAVELFAANLHSFHAPRSADDAPLPFTLARCSA